jgi:hypothetical protein
LVSKAREGFEINAVFGCNELGSELNWQWKTKSTKSMEYHKECLDARGIQLQNSSFNGIPNPVWMSHV